MLQLPAPQLEWFANLSVNVAAPQEVGQTVHGLRRLIPIIGGEVEGNGWPPACYLEGQTFNWW